MTKKTSKKTDKVWVEIEVNKFTEGIIVFRGQLNVSDLEAWAHGELVDCSLKIENTYWHRGETVYMLGKGDKLAKQYTGDTYLRVDTIMAIFVLRESSYPGNKELAGENIFPFPGRG